LSCSTIVFLLEHKEYIIIISLNDRGIIILQKLPKQFSTPKAVRLMVFAADKPAAVVLL
jgi:hypothetical protein